MTNHMLLVYFRLGKNLSSFIQNRSFCQRDINTQRFFNIVASILDNKQLRMEGGEFGSSVVTSINSSDGMAGYFQLSTKAEEKKRGWV